MLLVESRFKLTGIANLMYPDSEILFPARCISELRNVRPGESWRALVDHIASLPESHEDVLSFSLMMIRLSNCLTCDLDSYRASLGCGQCARRTIQGFKGNDKELQRKLEDARSELHAYSDDAEHASLARPQGLVRGQAPSIRSRARGKR
jgi:hypothetical protein